MSRKKAVLSEPKETSIAAAQNSTNDARLRRPAKERLNRSVLEELWSIWRADPQVPSVKSRRLWAISRNANPRLVDSWFLRRRTCAKKAGQPITDGSYYLPLEPTIAPKREQSAILIESELEAIPDLPSDDTLVYPPDVDDLKDLDASSDTVFDEDTLIDSKRPETPAYTKEIHQQPRPEYRPSQPKSSSANLYAAEDRCGKDALSFENLSFRVCNQGRGKPSNFTCLLCSSGSAQGTPDVFQSDASALSDSGGTSPIPCSRLDISPATPSELSAIPFLFRTPPAVPPDNGVNHQSVDDWTIVEDELGRLVNDGKLDFSFLDVPHLTSMELID